MDSQAIIDSARAARRSAIDELSGKSLLGTFGINVPRSAIVTTPQQAAAVAATMSAPYVVKVISQDILHKSDAGGVMLNLADAQAAGEAVRRMSQVPAVAAAEVDGYLLEEMSPQGLEIAIGAVRDAEFGALLMVGLGGIFIEVLRDVAFRICPIDERDAYAMLSELRGAKLLDGVRGTAPVDKRKLVDILLAIGGANGLLETHANDIAELDINPVIATCNTAVAVDARVILTHESDQTNAMVDSQAPRRPLTATQFSALFEPRTIAVLGASTTQTSIANTFIRRLRDFGYSGDIYPIHPHAEEIEGLPCYSSLADAPTSIDYAYIGIGANRIPEVLGGANGNLKFAHVISSGFGEVADGVDLQHQLLEQALIGGCRVIGPNCLGMYSPRGGVTFSVDAPQELGTIGVVSQSGGLGTDIIKRGQWRGVRFSALVTVGNSADIGPVDLFEYFLQDPHTHAIGLYLEDIKHGRRFFELLRDNLTKPVVILRGGSSAQGKQAAASHTGALAGDSRTWDALARQTGCVLVATVDEFVNALLAFQFLPIRPSRPTEQVALFGNGGGTSVLATDYFATVGLDVKPFGHEALSLLEAMNLPPGTSVMNPVDTPVATLQQREGLVANQILDIIYSVAKPDAVVMHLNLASFVGRGDVDPIDNLIKAATQVQGTHPGQAHFVMVLRVDGSPQLDAKMRDYRERILAAGIPVYDELATAGKALEALSLVEQNFHQRQGRKAQQP